MGLPDPDPYLNPYSLIKDWKNLRKKSCIHIFKSKVKKWHTSFVKTYFYSIATKWPGSNWILPDLSLTAIKWLPRSVIHIYGSSDPEIRNAVFISILTLYTWSTLYSRISRACGRSRGTTPPQRPRPALRSLSASLGTPPLRLSTKKSNICTESNNIG